MKSACLATADGEITILRTAKPAEIKASEVTAKQEFSGRLRPLQQDAVDSGASW
jgi:hypothetical protein